MLRGSFCFESFAAAVVVELETEVKPSAAAVSCLKCMKQLHSLFDRKKYFYGTSLGNWNEAQHNALCIAVHAQFASAHQSQFEHNIIQCVIQFIVFDYQWDCILALGESDEESGGFTSFHCDIMSVSLLSSINEQSHLRAFPFKVGRHGIAIDRSLLTSDDYATGSALLSSEECAYLYSEAEERVKNEERLCLFAIKTSIGRYTGHRPLCKSLGVNCFGEWVETDLSRLSGGTAAAALACDLPSDVSHCQLVYSHCLHSLCLLSGSKRRNCYAYDITEHGWRAIASCHISHAAGCAISTSFTSSPLEEAEYIFLCGGGQSKGRCEILKMGTIHHDEWSYMPPMLAGNHTNGAIACLNDQHSILIAGGTYTDAVEMFNCDKQAWHLLSPIPSENQISTRGKLIVNHDIVHLLGNSDHYMLDLRSGKWSSMRKAASSDDSLEAYYHIDIEKDKCTLRYF